MSRYKIFIVDDNIDNLKTFINIFEQCCPLYDIFQTNNPLNAVDIALKVSPNLIITDWDMPKLSGIDIIKQLKEKKETKNIPVIMATGVHITSVDLQNALETGAVDFIRKPIDQIELIARTHSALLISEYQKQIIQAKDKELAESALHLIKSNEFNTGIIKKLNKLTTHLENKNKEAKYLVNSIVNDLNNRIKEDSWFRFHLSFDSIHNDFKRNLTKEYSELTSTDINLCTFIRLGMNIKDIASVLNLSPDSVKVSRSRLRKKLNLKQSQNLETFLLSF
jgi:DNA-binding NarL/FixJ family response regulator